MTTYPLIAMTPEDDFPAYEKLVMRAMKAEDYYSAAEMKEGLETGLLSAWWVRDGAQTPIAWCAIKNTVTDWAGACSFTGLAIAPEHRNTNLALRMIRHVLKEVGNRPLAAYIQPGGETERLLDLFGFQYVDRKEHWNFYIRLPSRT